MWLTSLKPGDVLCIDWLGHHCFTWWCHQMETFSALLAICQGNSPVPGEFPAHRPVTRSFDVFFDLRLNKRLSEQSWGWRFETLSCPLWRHRYELLASCLFGAMPLPETMTLFNWTFSIRLHWTLNRDSYTSHWLVFLLQKTDMNRVYIILFQLFR